VTESFLFSNKINFYDSETLVTEKKRSLEFRSTVDTILKFK